MISNSKGFGAIELSIVMVILIALSVVSVFYFMDISQKTRDSTRRADVYAIATALEVNKTLEGYVPLETDQFSSFQWQDPSGNAYCIAAGIPPDPMTKSLWGKNCPEGFKSVAPGAPEEKFTNWKVCSVLEKPKEGDLKVFCKIQRQ